MLSSLLGTVSATVSDNTISIGTLAQAKADGFQVWNTPTTGSVTISGGSVTGGTYGVWVDSFEGYPSTGSAASATQATITGLAISNASLAGIYVEDSADNTAHPAVSVTVNGNTTIAGGASGILVSGASVGQCHQRHHRRRTHGS